MDRNEDLYDDSSFGFDDDELSLNDDEDMDVELGESSEEESNDIEDTLDDVDLGSMETDESAEDEDGITEDNGSDPFADDPFGEDDEPKEYSLNEADGKYYSPDGREVAFDDEGHPYYTDMFDESEYEASATPDYDDSEVSGGIDIDDIDSELRGTNNYDEFNSESESDSDSDETESDELGDDTDETSYDSEDDDVNTINPSISNDFIDADGNLSVMNGGDSKDTFEIKVLAYKNIAISKRIRSGKTVEDLVQSIKSTGLLRPIIVAPLKTEGSYVLIDGYRRILACAKAGITEIPAVVNNKIKTAEIPIVEAMYNHRKPYTMQDTVDYINYLEKEKGITNPSLIEFLMELDNGDYNKLKDIITDDDEDIVGKLMLGQLTIAQAFKQLEKRRAKESREEKDLKKAAKVYEDTEESGANAIEDSGESADEGAALTDEQIAEITIDPTQIDSNIDEGSLSEAVEASDNTPGFEAHKQKVGEREYIDPAIKKAVMARDGSICQCCKKGGSQFVDILDYHHILPVFLGGSDTTDNGIMLCVACHRLVHLHSTGDLHIDPELLKEDYSEVNEATKAIYPNEELFKDEQRRFKRIIKLGSVIRNGVAARGMNREAFKKEHPNTGIGRRMPGKNASQEKA